MVLRRNARGLGGFCFWGETRPGGRVSEGWLWVVWVPVAPEFDSDDDEDRTAEYTLRDRRTLHSGCAVPESVQYTGNYVGALPQGSKLFNEQTDRKVCSLRSRIAWKWQRASRR